MSQSVVSIKLLYNFIEITLRQGSSSVNLLQIFRIHFPKNTFQSPFQEKVLTKLSSTIEVGINN